MQATDEILRLAPGALHLTRVEAGTLLLAEGAEILVEGPPHWIGEHLLAPRSCVREGCGHWVERAGWIRLSRAEGHQDDCQADGLVRLIAPPGSGDTPLDAVLARLRGLRRLENRLLAATARALRLRLAQPDAHD
ncbi:hypothetical protein [Zoogloea dura]|jgi:hypothetical protein|uniref:DUF2917 domain-containing protein n=1 Tax=Zoogloea dura TaxID=2728840 RepID=A0A848GCJ6_9RHOO|nr:hypothetical protein [Zoogloea dura]NML28466.1 hypothetical protein [Zoogloea dura]